jgi:tetratricopeptide (TPR) repeat protein
MNKRSFISHRSSFILLISALLAAVYGSVSAAADRIRLVRGSDNGEISDMSPTEIAIAKGGPGSRTIAVNQIKSIQFEGEPAELSQARVSVGNGAFAKAAQLLQKVTASGIQRDFIKQDIEYYKAYVAARLALAGDGQITDAGRLLNAFVRNYPKNFHYLEACEMMGDLLMATGRFDNAEKQYAALAQAPWPDYKMRAAVALGRSLQAQNKHAEAIKQFDAALALPDEGGDAPNQKLAATLGRAVSLAETGKADEAIGTIQKVIQDADPQQKELHARAYNALGMCYEKANKTKDALFAFLHVDVLYSTVPEAHAEALSHLVSLWKAVGQDERSREARETLQQKYAGSRWAKRM